jgi:periplasmic protein TonB
VTFAETDSGPSALLPRGLRLALIGLSIAAHMGLIVALSLSSRQVNVLAPINVDVIPQGDYFVDTVAVAGEAAAEAVVQRQTQTPVEKPNETVEETPAEQPAPQPLETNREAAPAPSALTPDPNARSAELEAHEKLRKLEARARVEAAEQARQRQRQMEKQERLREQRRRLLQARHEEMRNARSSNPGGSEGHRAGVRDGQAASAARFNYGMIVAAELNRHKSYPASARARGDTGSVGVNFTVGGSGRVVAHSIYASSGSSALDGVVHAMMAAAHPPPPPGGVFHGRITINFNLSR